MTKLAQKLVAVLAHLSVEDVTVTKSSHWLAMVKSRSKVGASSKLTSSRWNPNVHLLKMKGETICTVYSSVSATTVPRHLLPSITWILNSLSVMSYTESSNRKGFHRLHIMLHIVIILLQNTFFYPKVSVSPVNICFGDVTIYGNCKASLMSLTFVNQKWFDAHVLSIKQKGEKEMSYPPQELHSCTVHPKSWGAWGHPYW